MGGARTRKLSNLAFRPMEERVVLAKEVAVEQTWRPQDMEGEGRGNAGH